MFVKELEITLENGMKISGELDLPERQGQWKTIILFHGSGPSDRHATVESMGGIVSRNFDLLSEGFVKARYAVFRYDKRENYDIEIIIRDAREVTRFVSGLSEVEGILFAPVGSRISVATQGRLRYETYITDIKQVGMDQWTWRLTYKVFCGKNIVSTVDSLMSWNYQSVEKILNQLTKMHFRTAKLSETLLLAIKAR